MKLIMIVVTGIIIMCSLEILVGIWMNRHLIIYLDSIIIKFMETINNK
jgi:hypothetical protein